MAQLKSTLIDLNPLKKQGNKAQVEIQRERLNELTFILINSINLKDAIVRPSRIYKGEEMSRNSSSTTKVGVTNRKNTVDEFNAVYKLVKETGKLTPKGHANQSGSSEIKNSEHAQRLGIETGNRKKYSHESPTNESLKR